VAVVGGQEVQERRNQASEERRLAGSLLLSVSGPWQATFATGDVTSVDASDANLRLTLNMRVRVRNDGPRGVRVTQASAGGLVFQGSPVPLPAQTSVEFLMQLNEQCVPDIALPPQTTPDGPGAPGPLQVTAETAGGTRTITIKQPPYDTELASRWCRVLRQDG